MKKTTLVFLLILATVLTSFAHEFWLALEKFILKVGEKAKISFLVGEDFTGEIWKGSASSFYLFNSEGKKDITSLFPTTPEDGTSLTFTKEGTHLLAFNSQNKFIELEPDKFLAYLEEDGLEEVITLRKQRNETEKYGVPQSLDDFSVKLRCTCLFDILYFFKIVAFCQYKYLLVSDNPKIDVFAHNYRIG